MYTFIPGLIGPPGVSCGNHQCMGSLTIIEDVKQDAQDASSIRL